MVTNKYIMEKLKRVSGVQEKEKLAKNYVSFDKKGNPILSLVKLSKDLAEYYSIKTIYGNKSEEMWAYNFDEGIYIRNGREIVEVETERLLEGHSSNHSVREVLSRVQRITAINREDFEVIQDNLICLKNGIFDLQTNKFLEHSPNYYFKSKLPVAYSETAKCPKFLNFLEETLIPQDIPVIQEYFGFCLYRKYFLKRGMIFLGEKDTGKTALLKILIALIGENNTAGISLQRISANDKFALASLYQKSLNFFDDLSAKDLSDGGGFKIVTGGGYITAEHKFGDSFVFQNYAKQLFACNKIPPIKEQDDDAYFSRWLLIEFLNQVKPEEQNPKLQEEIMQEAEGILLWAIEGLKRLLNNNSFSYAKTKDEVKALMQSSSHQLARFSLECLTKKEGNIISKEEMYLAYSSWVEKEKLGRLTKEQLGRSLEKFATYLIASSNGKERYWLNVSFTDTYDTLLKNIKGVEKREDYTTDMLSKKVSYPSKESKISDFNDTYDTNNEKEGEANPKKCKVCGKYGFLTQDGETFYCRRHGEEFLGIERGLDD